METEEEVITTITNHSRVEEEVFYRGGKNYFGGRGRGNPTYQQVQHSHSYQQFQQQSQPRGETDKSQ